MATYRGRSPSPTPKLSEEQKKSQDLAMQAQKKRYQTKTKFFNQYGYHIVIGIFVTVIVIALASTVFSGKKDPKITPVIELEEIESHNANDYPYKLGSNEFFDQWMLVDAKRILNTQLAHKQQLQYCPTHEDSSIIPDKFNFREAHPLCAQPIQNQGNCSSSYALTAASTVADRFCVINGLPVKLSPQPLLQCDKNFTLGCEGGYVSRSFDYTKRHGLVEDDCLPYNFEKIEEDCQIKQCQKYKIVDQCVASKEEGIKRELYQHGPVVAVIPMFRDFLIYKEGIYHVFEGASKFQSGHAIKIIGWDTDQATKTDYWIIENTWGETWGEQGFARIATKQTQLYLDEFALAPIIEMPKKPEDQDDSVVPPPSQEAPEHQNLD